MKERKERSRKDRAVLVAILIIVFAFVCMVPYLCGFLGPLVQ